VGGGRSGGSDLIGVGKIEAMYVGAVRATEAGVTGWRTAEDKNVVIPSRVRARVVVDVFFLTALGLDFRRGISPLKSEIADWEAVVEVSPRNLEVEDWFEVGAGGSSDGEEICGKIKFVKLKGSGDFNEI